MSISIYLVPYFYMSVSVSVSVCLRLALSLPLSLPHTHSLTRSFSHTHTCARALSLSPSLHPFLSFSQHVVSACFVCFVREKENSTRDTKSVTILAVRRHSHLSRQCWSTRFAPPVCSSCTVDKRGTSAQGLDSVLQSHGVLSPKTDATGATAEDVEKRHFQELQEQTDMVRVLSAKKAEAEMVHI